MNKHIKKLLCALLAISATHLQASNRYTNQTYLAPRPHGVNLPMEYTAFHELFERKVGHTFGGNLQVTGFYQGSTESEDIARYFLFNKKDSITLTKAAVAANTTISTAADLDLGYLIHEQAGANAHSAKVTFRPQQQSYGVRFDYRQDLSKIMNGLYFYANVPVVYVENNVRIAVSAAGNYLVADNVTPVDTPVKTVVEKFFNGTFENTGAGNNHQAKLTNARISGKQRTTNLADLDMGLGYHFWNKERFAIALAAAVTIPTGNKAEGVYLFEPLAGNGKHFAVGADLDAHVRIWGRHDHNVKLALVAKYRYLFEHIERRTVGIKGRNWGQYHLLATTNSPAATQQLTPAANVLTFNMDVTPGSQFDGVLNMCYNNCNFSVDLGYNLYYREDETVKLRDTFTDSIYAIAARNFDTSADFLVVAAGAPVTPITPSNRIDGDVANGAASILTNASLDFDRAKTPSQTTHSLYGNLCYHVSQGSNPWLLATGGKYEWPDQNSALQQWSVWGKVGVGF